MTAALLLLLVAAPAAARDVHSLANFDAVRTLVDAGAPAQILSHYADATGHAPRLAR